MCVCVIVYQTMETMSLLDQKSNAEMPECKKAALKYFWRSLFNKTSTSSSSSAKIFLFSFFYCVHDFREEAIWAGEVKKKKNHKPFSKNRKNLLLVKLIDANARQTCIDI